MIADFFRSVIPKRFRPIGFLEHLVRTRTHGRVLKGPFAGMHYIEGAAGSAYVPKLLGIYERELNPQIEAACGMAFALIIDIGAAEGYYAVGMARRNPESKVIAFEMEEHARTMLLEMARRNDVADRIEIRGKCEVEDLASTLVAGRRALVICDVEGYEEALLRPDKVPGLLHAHVLVEVHEFILKGITEQLTQRFAPSHRVLRIWQEPRDRSEFPFPTIGTALLPSRYLDWAVSEWRPERMSWLWMEPHA